MNSVLSLARLKNARTAFFNRQLAHQVLSYEASISFKNAIYSVNPA